VLTDPSYRLPKQWSIWLSVFWGSWWGATASFMMLPPILRSTVAVVIGGDRSWVDIVAALRKWLTFFAWSLVSWIAFVPLILRRQNGSASSASSSNLATMSNILFGIFLCSCVIGGEKIVVQFIACASFQLRASSPSSYS
jgi:hypothetical protein